jgi:hypothetical protein
MTADSDTNPVTDWDEARLALGRVSRYFQDHPGFNPADLPSKARELAASGSDELENYELIPQPVRYAMEGLSPDEMRIVIDTLATLAENHFYLENNVGRGLEPY